MPQSNDPLRSSHRRWLRTLLILTLAALPALLGACSPDDAEGAQDDQQAETSAMTSAMTADDEGAATSGEDAPSYEDRMAREHRDETPEASGAARAPRTAVRGETVTYATVDGREITGYAAQPENAAGALPGIVVIHEWWGLNDNIRAMAERLAGEGYKALAVDLYAGQGADSPERARELVGSVDEAQAKENLRQAVAWLEDYGSQRIAVIGWCFGGGWSLRAALDQPETFDAAVIYYGRLITDPEELAPLEAPVLGIFGAEDGGIPVESVRAFESALEEAGKTAEIHIYEGAGHAFANPSGQRYRPEDAEDAWGKTVSFLGRHLAGAMP